MERTEIEALTQRPIKAILGGKEVEIPLLVLEKSLAWTEKWWQAIYGADGWRDSVARIEKVKEEKGSDLELQGAVAGWFKNIFISQPSDVINLVCDYVEWSGCGITREQIMKTANNFEIRDLWTKINEVEGTGNPLVTSLAQAVNQKK